MRFFALIFIALISFTSCEDDFSEVGSNIVGNNNFDALLFDEVEIDAYNRKIERIQTSALTGHNLGVFNDPVYGKTNANILTQVRLESTDPDFGDNTVLDSVILTFPYYSSITEQSSNGSTYVLDSIFGSGPINFSIHESNYFLRSTDPNNNYEPQVYYSDQQEQFEQNIESTPILEVDNFTPSANEIITYEPNDDGGLDTIRTNPKLRLALPVDFFQDKIIDKEGTSVLLSQDNFRNYFRGLYFKVDPSIQEGIGMLLNLNPSSEPDQIENRANITLYYRSTIQDIDGEEIENNNEFRLTFGPNIVNVYESEYEEIPSQDNLYLKGGQGSLAIIDIFKDTQQLDSIRDSNWLVNEANLSFYVNESEVPEGDHEPERIFIYDVNNGSILADYANDISATDNGSTSRFNHLGPLSTDENGNRFYKLRITDYIHNIINNDSTNTRLGVYVTQNVNVVSQIAVEVAEEEEIDIAPSSASISQEGTVLHGVNAPTDTKKLKLNIFYTQAE